MPSPASLILLASLLPAAAGAQEKATGTVTLDQPPPQARGAIVTLPDGREVELPRGASAQVQGANLVVERETARGTTLTVSNDVLFDFDKAELRPQAAAALQRVAEVIHQRQPRAVRILGYTDSIGGEAYNDALTRRRAEAVRAWLASHGDAPPPLAAKGRGERDPVAPNTLDGRDNPEGRQQNRRVEVLLEK